MDVFAKLTEMRVFALEESRAVGLSRQDREDALRAGVIVKPRRSVFATAAAVAHAKRSKDASHAFEVEALLKALSRERIAAAGTSAGLIHGLEFAVDPTPGLVVCTPDPWVGGTARDGYKMRAAALPEEQVVSVHHVPVTSVARTLFDLAGDLPYAHAVATTDHARHWHFVTQDELEGALAWGAGRPDVHKARKVFAFSDPRSESVLESISRVGMDEQGVPAPRLQVDIRNAEGRFVGRADFAWDLPVVGDPGGWKKFRKPGTDDVPLSVVKNYFARRQAMIDLGLDVVTWTWEEAQDPPVVAKRLFAAFERAESLLAARARRARTGAANV